ncbi:hypothetical protein EKD16_00600 [Streptomonospora litoralis]|uniref:Uncharacterized protein n=1 Tax=Streptomonospora litoralis TaxID=2498135 RepID=A0A4P6PWD5_9ACTN|nr:hypothetical protein EKD16_00600 [Streptomonospora litoralis]
MTVICAPMAVVGIGNVIRGFTAGSLGWTMLGAVAFALFASIAAVCGDRLRRTRHQTESSAREAA